ncbi:hypothetical protein DPX16_22306 [Anabarilius grahami]|uniref:Endonuclease/exonuclease/phosphatase domain-containing protein n=1 Tax=Anabarilius grahami TaxID=495550 RepID=A0A3N0YVI1_ANAGA|nr:hypothetical protein DPX16_22306 [Anabarilius grahami]
MHELEGWSSHHEGAAMMTPAESARVSRSPRQVQWDSDISEHEQYSPSHDTHSIGRRAEWTDTSTPYAEEGNELYEMRRESTSLRRSEENMQSSYAQHWAEFLQLLDFLNLQQHVDVRTPFRGHTLDLVISNLAPISNLLVYELGVSDHEVISMELPLPSSYTKDKRQICFRDLKKIILDTLTINLQHLSSVDFS